MTQTRSSERETRIPWGSEGTLTLALPPAWPIPEVVPPDLSGPLPDYPSALEHALGHPEGNGSTLGALLREGMKVAIVVDDPSRWTPVRESLPIVLKRIHEAGVKVADVSISVAVGRHLPVDDPSMRLRVGDAIVETYTCHSPPVDDLSAYHDLGTTSEGVPVRVFKPVAEAGLRILIGSVLPHLQAGFGGGYKLIFPGTSHRTTLGALHRQGLGKTGDAATLLGGSLTENPMRKAIGSASRLLGPCVSISHLIGAPGEIFRVRTGDPNLVQAALADEARHRLQFHPNPADPSPADIVAAGNHPWPGDPMQSFKVLLQHRAACRKGGILAGFFWTDPEQIDRSFPLTAMKAIAASGPVGGWILKSGLSSADHVSSWLNLPSAFMIRWARELVVDRTVLVFSPPLRERLGPRLGPIRLFDDQAALWKAAGEVLARQGIEAPRTRIFPQGGLTYASAQT